MKEAVTSTTKYCALTCGIFQLEDVLQHTCAVDATSLNCICNNLQTAAFAGLVGHAGMVAAYPINRVL